MVATLASPLRQKILLVHCVTDILGHKSYSNFDRSVVPPFFAFSKYPWRPWKSLPRPKPNTKAFARRQQWVTFHF